ncbi:hypothetical protein EZV62_003903 [Acer yangbiense]|uniref:Phosphofructokinase domain-containing protein n=1 Tax=Acer yangbiense TaxID=1000413 RepID=A0A5C7IIK7_9ROSI|nr:hypothetical protein EZV62_003903 [Acer yangbiense]
MALLTHPKIESEAEGTINININIPCINLEKLPHLTSSSSSPSPHLAYLRAGPCVHHRWDGTICEAVKIFYEIQCSKLNVGVPGIPKTVDNDVGIIDISLGFQTIIAADVEVESGVNGIGLVKLMGRSTGHIALHVTLSSHGVDYCLIPKNKFYLEGKGGLFQFLEHRLKENGHATVVVVVSPRE